MSHYDQVNGQNKLMKAFLILYDYNFPGIEFNGQDSMGPV